MNKQMFNSIRNQYLISKALRMALRPVQRLCHAVDRQIKIKVWANGENVTYDNLNIKFPKNIGTSYCSSIYWNDVNGFEPDTWRVIRYFLGRAKTFIDIGSNIGFYSVLAKTLYPSIDIISYEPIPSIFAKNIDFHKANHLDSDHIKNAAIGEVDGKVEIYLPTVSESLEEQTTATLRKDSWQFSKEHTTFKVSSIPLDNVLMKYHPSDKIFIKIDVEDYESGVLKSGSVYLRELKPIIVCEILPRDHGNQETINILDGCDYVAYGIASDGLVKFSAKDFAGPRTIRDFLLLHNSIAPSLNYIDYRRLDSIHW